MSDELPVKYYSNACLTQKKKYFTQSNTMMWRLSQRRQAQAKPPVPHSLSIELPQFLIQAGYTLNDKKIAIILPRKIAAISIAKRVAEELGCHNAEIAHKVRFNSQVNSNTRVVFMTDGSLVQELYSSPLL